MSSTDPGQQLAQMATGYWISQAIYVAAKLQIADLLAEGPLSAAALANKIEGPIDEQALYRLLRALASVGIFAEDNAGRFGLTPLAEPLQASIAGSRRAMILMMGEEHYRAWGELLHSVQTGKTAFERVFGQPIFDYLSERPAAARLFDEAMVSIHGPETAAMLDAYDFSQFGVLADLGGGNGSVLRGVLAKHPNVRGILFDLPGVVASATEQMRAAGLAERCTCQGGSFFETAPAGADAYFLRHILHDWTDEQCLTILRNIHRESPPHARLLVVESVIAPGNDPGFAKLLDLTMLVIPGGRERTEAEYRDLLAQGGFRLERIVRTTTEVSILEASKVASAGG
jgi:hypothetical protein